MSIWRKGDPIYHIGDTAFSFYLIEKGKVEINDRSGSVRTLVPGEHFGERALLAKYQAPV